MVAERNTIVIKDSVETKRRYNPWDKLLAKPDLLNDEYDNDCDDNPWRETGWTNYSDFDWQQWNTQSDDDNGDMETDAVHEAEDRLKDDFDEFMGSLGDETPLESGFFHKDAEEHDIATP